MTLDVMTIRVGVPADAPARPKGFRCWDPQRKLWRRHRWDWEEYPTDYDGDGGPIMGQICRNCWTWKS